MRGAMQCIALSYLLACCRVCQAVCQGFLPSARLNEHGCLGAGCAHAGTEADDELVEAVMNALGRVADQEQGMQLVKELRSWCTKQLPWHLQCCALDSLQNMSTQDFKTGAFMLLQ